MACHNASRIALAIIASAGTAGAPARAADFYAGKTITISTYGAPGDSYDVYMRLLSRHYGRHIPGNPRFTPINQPGAGGLVAINHAGRGGAAGRHLHHGREPGPLDLRGDRTDAGCVTSIGNFKWLGSFTQSNNVTVTWHTSSAKTIAGRDGPRGRGRRERSRRRFGDRTRHLQRGARHEIQDRLRLPGRRAHRSRDEARRGRGPRQQHLGGLQGDDAERGQGRHAQRADPDRLAQGPRPAARAVVPRSREGRCRARAGRAVHVEGGRDRAAGRGAARRAGGACRAAAPRLRCDHERTRSSSPRPTSSTPRSTR